VGVVAGEELVHRWVLVDLVVRLVRPFQVAQMVLLVQQVQTFQKDH